MGASSSKLDKVLLDLPETEKYFGLENFGNTCYCNSVLQALYFCRPFREHLLNYAERLPPGYEDNLLTALAELFWQISTQKKKSGTLKPSKFVQRVKKDNQLFSGYMHQDAHEFLNFLLNEAHDILEKQQKERQAAAFQKAAGQLGLRPTVNLAPRKTWIQSLFQGKWVNETRCLQCEAVSSREETFFEWSLEIEPNTSVTSCLRNFSSTEMLDGDNKFSCDKCGSLQEAQKRVRCKELPPVLCLHLKRFYMDTYGRMRKLTHRVVFSLDLKLSNMVDDMVGADALYQLFAVVVHVGGGINHGHYISLVKTHGRWLYFDDDKVEPVEVEYMQNIFGSSSEFNNNLEHGYILMYERVGGQSSNGLTNGVLRPGDGSSGRIDVKSDSSSMETN